MFKELIEMADGRIAAPAPEPDTAVMTVSVDVG